MRFGRWAGFGCWRKPFFLTFFVSLLLSLIATLGAVTVGSDAALYLDTAQTFTKSGWQAAYQQFNWPWFSILLGILHQLTSIPLEPLAYGVCALFMAGACALLVKVLAARVPGLGWWACLVVLSVPAFNSFRGEILREFGYWFFCILALVLSIAWAERGGWLRGGAVYAAILLAALFRLEALFLVIAICAWQLITIRGWADFERSLQLLCLPFAGLLFLGGIYFFGTEGASVARIKSFMTILRPELALESFQRISSQFADSMTYRYSRDEARQIVFFGIIATLLLEFLKSLGPMAIPFFTRRLSTMLGQTGKIFAPFGWAYFFYFIVLMLFFWRMQFVNGRYASMLAWLAVPFVAVLMMGFARHRPRLGKLLVALAILFMFANVISLSAKKSHYKDAGEWVESNLSPAARVYFQDRRISYYAGRRVLQNYPVRIAMTQRATEFDCFVLQLSVRDLDLKAFMNRESLEVLAAFENSDGDAVTILARAPAG